MKGFARILETIIAAIIILTSLSFFLPITIKQSQWDNTISSIRAQDAINVAYETGNLAPYVKSNDNTSLGNFLETLFTKSTDFSIEIKGIPNPIIFVGCSCDDGQLADINSRMAPLNFTYKGRNIEIRAERVSVANIPDQTNVLLFMSFANLSGEYAGRRNSIEKFIENGGTVFLLGDITQSNTNSDVMKNLFNLTWNAQDQGSQNGNFNDFGNPQRITYNIANYYQNTTGRDPSNEKFKNFDSSNALNSIVVDNKTVIETDNQKISFVAGNRNVINGNGRTIWFADNDRSTEINNLTKAVMMWASGEKYKMDGAVKKTPPRARQTANMIVQDNDAYEFTITTWNVF